MNYYDIKKSDILKTDQIMWQQRHISEELLRE